MLIMWFSFVVTMPGDFTKHRKQLKKNLRREKGNHIWSGWEPWEEEIMYAQQKYGDTWFIFS